jgi:hypothetical protein
MLLEKNNSETVEIDYLLEDLPLMNQKYVCLSFISPESVKSDKKFDVRAVKVRGVYDTYEEAEKRVLQIRRFDSDFNIYIGEVGKWLANCDKPEMAKDENYANNELQKLMKNYKEEQNKAKEFHEERKQMMVDEAVKEVEKKKLTKRKNKENEIIPENTNFELNNELNTNLQKLKEQNDELLKARDIINDKENNMKKIKEEFEKVKKEVENKSVNNNDVNITKLLAEMEAVKLELDNKESNDNNI